MDPVNTPQTRAPATSFFGRSRNWIARTSLTARVTFGLFLFAALMMGLHTALAPKDSSLRISVQHNFRSADISVWVDGNLSYSGKLSGSAKKKFGLIAGATQGSLTDSVPLSAGIHQIRVQVQTDSGTMQQGLISGDFTSSSERKLSVSARPGSVNLAWQGVGPAMPAPSSSGWMARYASAFALTIGGSIVSALTGFALRELPGHLRPRQEEAEVKAQSAAAGS